MAFVEAFPVEMVAGNSGDEVDSQEGNKNGFEQEPGGGFELRRRKVVECAKETLDQASRLLKRKIPCAGHLLAPKRLWLRRVATPNCDVVIVFSQSAKDSVLMWLLGRLRQSTGLSVHVRQHASTQSTAFYISAPFQVLLRAAEDHHLPKTLRAARGGGLKEFSLQEAQCFEDADNEQTFFTTQERQWLVLRVLEAVRAKGSDKEALLPGTVLLEGQLLIPKCVSAGVISQMFPLHDAPALEKLQVTWVRDILARQPLGELSGVSGCPFGCYMSFCFADYICEYFGVKIGMYFAWLGHYTAALSIPAIVGLMFWVSRREYFFCLSNDYQNWCGLYSDSRIFNDFLIFEKLVTVLKKKWF